jgi:cell division protein FtsW
MFVTAGGRWRDVFIAGLIGIIFLAGLAYSRPYIFDRIETFIKPGEDLQGSSYQLNQSLIAIGSGQIFGRGFGQSVQKFNYLPEPIGDSIFAVAAEEWGFVGSTVLIFLFLAFAIRGLKIATWSSDIFGGLLATGIVILITVQSLVNIASMLGVFPLTGMPLLFVSHGGTALFFAMAEVGIILNISKQRQLT